MWKHGGLQNRTVTGSNPSTPARISPERLCLQDLVEYHGESPTKTKEIRDLRPRE